MVLLLNSAYIWSAAFLDTALLAWWNPSCHLFLFNKTHYYYNYILQLFSIFSFSALILIDWIISLFSLFVQHNENNYINVYTLVCHLSPPDCDVLHTNLISWNITGPSHHPLVDKLYQTSIAWSQLAVYRCQEGCEQTAGNSPGVSNWNNRILCLWCAPAPNSCKEQKDPCCWPSHAISMCPAWLAPEKAWNYYYKANNSNKIYIIFQYF